MTAQFPHWTAADIRDRFTAGMTAFRIARMTGRTVPEIRSILFYGAV